MVAANVRTVAGGEEEYRLYREFHEREVEKAGGCLSVLAVPAAALGCLLATLMLGGAL